MEEYDENEMQGSQFDVFKFIKILGVLIIILGTIGSAIFTFEFGYVEQEIAGYSYGGWNTYTIAIGIGVFVQSLVLGSLLLGFGKLGEIVDDFAYKWEQANEKK